MRPDEEVYATSVREGYVFVSTTNRRTLFLYWSESVSKQHVSASCQVPFQSTDTGLNAERQWRLRALAASFDSGLMVKDSLDKFTSTLTTSEELKYRIT